MNILLVIDQLLGLVERATQYATLLRQAQAEGRDISDAELDGLRAKDDAAKAALDAAIAKAREP